MSKPTTKAPQLAFLRDIERLAPGVARLAAVQWQRTVNGEDEYPMRPHPRRDWPARAVTLTHCNTATFHRGAKRATLKNVAGVWALLIEDVGTKVARDPGKRLAPTWIVETRPGNAQYGYVLNRIYPHDEGQPVLDALAAAGWTDPGAARVLQWFRLPGSRPPGKPATARLVEFNAHTITLVQFVKAFKLKPKPRRCANSTPYGIRVVRPAIGPALLAANIQTYNAVLETLVDLGLVREQTPDGRVHLVKCPWAAEHTQPSKRTTVTLMPPDGEKNGWRGGFSCLHGHCRHRGFADLERWAYESTEEKKK